MVRKFGVIGFASVLGLTVSGIVIEPDSRVWVEGKSTVRDWSCTATVVDGSVDAVPGVTLSLDRLAGAVQGVALRMPVAKLDCGNGTMNGHMRKALKADESGSIEFRLSDYTAAPSATADTELQLSGSLVIAGTERPVTIVARATQEENGVVRIEGSRTIAMTEWGVKPPSLMLGTMKVKDDVVVHFDIRLRQN